MPRKYAIVEGQLSLGNFFSPVAVIEPEVVTPLFNAEPEKVLENVIEITGRVAGFEPSVLPVIPTKEDERIKANIEALKLLDALRVSGEYPTPEQMNILFTYSGWENISSDAISKALTPIYDEDKIEEILGLPRYPYHPSEFVASDVNAVLAKIGFSGGNVLLSNVGAGHIYLGLNEQVRANSLIEIDPTDGVNGQIASYLFPNTKVKDMDAPLPENFYDLAVGLVPDSGKKRELLIKSNSITLPDYACSMARTLSSLRVGGFYLLLIKANRTETIPAQYTPFELSTAPLTFVGGLRLDDTVMQNGQIYDLLVFQKIPDKRKIYTGDLFSIMPLTVPLSDGSGGHRITSSAYFRFDPKCVIGKLICVKEKIAGFNSKTLIVKMNPLPESERGLAVSTALDGWKDNEYTPIETDAETEGSSLPADPSVVNYSMVVIDGEVYQRIDSRMVLQNLSGKKLERVIAMIAIRDKAKEVYRLQLASCSDKELEVVQGELNTLYDTFVGEFGHITDSVNRRLIREDADYAILAALETLDEEDEILKSDIFFKRTVMVRPETTSCDTVAEGFMICLDQKGIVDINHIAALCSKSTEEVVSQGIGKLFFRSPVPGEEVWIAKDEYLSGNVRQKYDDAKQAALDDSTFEVNVKALESVLPPLIPASDIDVKLNSPFLNPKLVEKFLYEVIGEKSVWGYRALPRLERNPKGRWAVHSSGWFNKNDPRLCSVYGIMDYTAIRIIENLMNSTEIVVLKDEFTTTGKNKRVKDQERTVMALEKAELIISEFKRWVLDGGPREADIVESFNKGLNSNVVPKFDGSHLTFPGMTETIRLRAHQKNSVYRIMRDNGGLLNHVVGAGKTFSIIAAAMKLKQVGRISKPWVVVPNNLISQWGGEAVRLYPTAKVLIAEPDDMRKHRRKRFLSRVATGDYDLVIIGQSSFINVPPPFNSVCESIEQLEEKIKEIKDSQTSTRRKRSRGIFREDRRLARNQRDELTFFRRCTTEEFDLESAGVDFLFVDEGHEYKNLASTTSQGNIKGLSNSGNVAKCTDMYYKMRYFNKLHGGKGGSVWATGTALTNTIAEMYALQRYFDEDSLLERGITNLDEWLATFGNITSDWELPPEGLAEDGSGFREVKRVSSFSNVPELMGMVLQFMDVATRDEIDMETPSPIRSTITCLQSPEQAAYMKSLVSRANALRGGCVSSSTDNMLCVTTDGRKAALDIRLVNPKAANHKRSKVSLCAEDVVKVYHQFAPIKGTQLIFSDIGVSGEKGFSVYKALKEKLVEGGIPEHEIAFSQDFDTPAKRVSMRLKMQTGKLRVLIGSTKSMGQGLNIQKRLVKLHHLDVPWIPKDVEQREGRILRNGNINTQVYITNYVTEGSFDAYMYQLLEFKMRLISQIMRGDYSQRTIEDVDTTVLSYAEIKAIATGDTRFLERVKVESELKRLETLRRGYEERTTKLRNDVNFVLPESISQLEALIPRIEKDVKAIEGNNSDVFTIAGQNYNWLDDGEKKAAYKALREEMDSVKAGIPVGTYKGMSILLIPVEASLTLYSTAHAGFRVSVQGNAAHSFNTEWSAGIFKNSDAILRQCRQIIESIPKELELKREKLAATKNALVAARAMLDEGFEHGERIKELQHELELLTEELAAA